MSVSSPASASSVSCTGAAGASSGLSEMGAAEPPRDDCFTETPGVSSASSPIATSNGDLCQFLS